MEPIVLAYLGIALMVGLWNRKCLWCDYLW